MRCSSCEPLLAEFVEGTLPPARAAGVASHLQRCAACESLHRRFREVDALLATAGSPALPADFTFDVMAAIRTLPAPAAAVRRPLWRIAGVYLVAAWIFVGAALSFLWPGAAGAARGTAQSAGSLLQAALHGTHALWPVAPIALSVVVSILALDVMLFALVILFYRSVVPRLTAHLATANVEVR